MILFETTLGNITVELFETDAPETTANFRQYVEDAFYDGTIFHRVIDGFMIQGGGFEPGMVQKDTRDPISNEASNGLTNNRGTYRDGEDNGSSFGDSAVLYQCD